MTIGDRAAPLALFAPFPLLMILPAAAPHRQAVLPACLPEPERPTTGADAGAVVLPFFQNNSLAKPFCCPRRPIRMQGMFSTCPLFLLYVSEAPPCCCGYRRPHPRKYAGACTLFLLLFHLPFYRLLCAAWPPFPVTARFNRTFPSCHPLSLLHL